MQNKDSNQVDDFLIQFTNSAKKSLDKIPFSEFILIDEKIKSLKLIPRPLDSVKIGKGYRIRIGNYRILYFIENNNKSINILDVLKRNDSYKKKNLKKMYKGN